MKVLLTGGMGYIGSHTAVELLNANIDVVIVDDLSNSELDVKDKIEKITGKKVKFYQVNIADVSAFEQVFLKEANIDAVIHFAAFKAVGESVAQPLKYYSNNLGATLTLLALMNKYKVNNLVFSSSATVYGTPKVVPLTEESPIGTCSNPYGWTKLMSEQIIRDYCVANPSFHAVFLRYFNPIGAHKSGLIGEHPHGIPNNIMPLINRVASGLDKELKVYGGDYPTRDGTGIRDYIHVVDLALGHVIAIDYCAKHTGMEIFNLGTGRGYSVLELIKSFEEVNGITIPYQIVERRPGDVAISYADVSKAKRVLGWHAKYELADMVSDAWNFQKTLNEVK